ncbi:MAG: hypothetical protein V1918_07680 [Planctomycetota bacterium]
MEKPYQPLHNNRVLAVCATATALLVGSFFIRREAAIPARAGVFLSSGYFQASMENAGNDPARMLTPEESRELSEYLQKSFSYRLNVWEWNASRADGTGRLVLILETPAERLYLYVWEDSFAPVFSDSAQDISLLRNRVQCPGILRFLTGLKGRETGPIPPSG